MVGGHPDPAPGLVDLFHRGVLAVALADGPGGRVDQDLHLVDRGRAADAVPDEGGGADLLEALGDFSAMTEADFARWTDQFQLLPGETLAGVLDDYAKVAQRTDELVASLPDLNVSHPLPKAPWFPPDATRSARRVFLHIIAETAQHAGHADIIRESLDGAKSMG